MRDFDDYGGAYLKYNPDTDETDPQKLRNKGSELYSKIKTKMSGDYATYMDAMGLGPDRIAYEVNQGLEASNPLIYHGEKVDGVETPDHKTRQRARELLADLHGLRKKTIQVDTGKIGELVNQFKNIGADAEETGGSDG